MDINMELIEVNKENQVVLKPEVENLLDEVMDYKKKVEEVEENLRKAILKAMVDNNIPSTKIGKYTISQVIPKDKIVFDKDSFTLNENEDIVNAFILINETETFNMDLFKSENPELYKKYVVKNIEYAVDEKRLSKGLPDIYKKYVTVTPSDKPITLRIVGKKE